MPAHRQIAHDIAPVTVRFSFENPEKIFCIVVAYIFGNLIHLTVRMYQQLFGFVHTNIIQIVDKFLSGLLFEKLAEIASVQVKEGSDEFWVIFF